MPTTYQTANESGVGLSALLSGIRFWPFDGGIYDSATKRFISRCELDSQRELEQAIVRVAVITGEKVAVVEKEVIIAMRAGKLDDLERGLKSGQIVFKDGLFVAR